MWLIEDDLHLAGSATPGKWSWLLWTRRKDTAQDICLQVPLTRHEHQSSSRMQEAQVGNGPFYSSSRASGPWDCPTVWISYDSQYSTVSKSKIKEHGLNQLIFILIILVIFEQSAMHKEKIIRECLRTVWTHALDMQWRRRGEFTLNSLKKIFVINYTKHIKIFLWMHRLRL